MPLSPLTIFDILVTSRNVSFAGPYLDNPIGMRNSSERTSPGCITLIFSAITLTPEKHVSNTLF